MSFTLGNNTVFIDSMLLMNSSLDKLVKNLGSEDFKYLSSVYNGEQLELVEKKVFILMSISRVLEYLKKENYLILIVLFLH